MSFPGSYNIRYYYGDTLEFRIFPKNASGEIFDLNTFTDVKFTLAENRNAPVSEHITCFAQISSDNTNILCTIRPEDSENINPDLQYVYDVEISKPNEPYDIVYTLLTGSVTIVRDVTRPEDGEPPVETPVPNNPTNLTLVNATTNSLEVSWDAPTEGPAPDFYKVDIIDFTQDEELILQTITLSTLTISPSQTSVLFSDLDEDSQYSVIVVATNIEDVFDEDTVLTNEEPFETLAQEVVPEFPLNPTDLIFESATENSITVTWSAPPGETDPSNYKLAILPFTTNQETLESAIFNSTIIVSAATLNRTFSGLSPETEYSVVIVSLNVQGEYDFEGALFNTEPFSTAAEPTLPPPTPDFFITNDGAGAYLIDGVSNDTITLVRGQTYIFELDASGHPFWIQSVPAPYNAGEVYSDGIEGNGTAVGIITWTVDESAPSTLYYVCQFHSAMSGTILIIDEES